VGDSGIGGGESRNNEGGIVESGIVGGTSMEGSRESIEVVPSISPISKLGAETILKAELSKAELLAGRAWKAAEKVVRLSPASARYPAIEIWE